MRYRFQFRRYRLPFRAPVRTAHGTWTDREGIIVRLEDVSEGGSGAVGYGEAAPIPWFGTESVDEVEAGCRAIGEWVEESAFDAVPKELACLQHALIEGRGDEGRGSRVEEPRVEGKGRGNSSIPPSRFSFSTPDPRPSTLGSSTLASRPPALAVAALLPAGRSALGLIEPKAEIGYRVFKWKVGVGDPADELALLDDICAALPNGAKLRLDANGAWDRRRAERWLERCADRPVEFVEQPCFAQASEGVTAQRRMDDVLLGLAADYPTPIALDESVVGDLDLERWIGAGWPGVFVLKPSLIGDVNAAMARLEKAKASVVFSSALETAVGAKSALRAAFAWAAAGTPVSSSGGENAPASSKPPANPRARALGFGVWPLFADARFDGPAAAPFVRYQDMERINPEAVWNSLS